MYKVTNRPEFRGNKKTIRQLYSMLLANNKRVGMINCMPKLKLMDQIQWKYSHSLSPLCAVWNTRGAEPAVTLPHTIWHPIRFYGIVATRDSFKRYFGHAVVILASAETPFEQYETVTTCFYMGSPHCTYQFSHSVFEMACNSWQSIKCGETRWKGASLTRDNSSRYAHKVEFALFSFIFNLYSMWYRGKESCIGFFLLSFNDTYTYRWKRNPGNDKANPIRA